MSARGGIVLGWLVKIVASIALAGVLLFEAGAVVIATVNADNAARAAAKESVDIFADTHDVRRARAEAEQLAAREGAAVIAFAADSEGVGGQERVTVTVEKKAKTIFIHKIGFLKRFARARTTARAFAV